MNHSDDGEKGRKTVEDGAGRVKKFQAGYRVYVIG